MSWHICQAAEMVVCVIFIFRAGEKGFILSPRDWTDSWSDGHLYQTNGILNLDLLNTNSISFSFRSNASIKFFVVVFFYCSGIIIWFLLIEVFGIEMRTPLVVLEHSRMKGL